MAAQRGAVPEAAGDGEEATGKSKLDGHGTTSRTPRLEGDTTLNVDETRAEIERRRRRAADLKLREILWDFYYFRLRSYESMKLRDPEYIYPEIRDTLETSGSSISFKATNTHFTVTYEEGPSEETREWRSGSTYESEDIKSARLKLAVDGHAVFEFDLKRIVRRFRDAPAFSEVMGTVSLFIEDTWVIEITALYLAVRLHENQIRDRRALPALKEMKRFGLE